ncbi:MAG: carbohydrate ABC transporter permease [Eubacteriales bacterium]|nr:carbohydrate ABC transporter permease [Eubacteriales bacterium]
MKTKKIIPIYILVVFACVVALFPFVFTFLAATHTNSQIYQLSYAFRLGGEFGNNLKSLSESFPIWRNIGNSILIAGIYTVLVLFVDSMAGYALAKYEFKGKNLIFSLCMMSMFIPTQVTMIPLFVEMTSFQMMNTIWAVILPGVASVFGVFLMRQNMTGFPNELLESARIDGAGDFRIFFRIVLPNMKSALASLGIVSFVNQYGNFMWPLIALNEKEKYTMPLVLSLMVQPGYVIDYGAVFTGTVLSLLPVLIFFLLFQKNFVDGMLAGAVKG